MMNNISSKKRFLIVFYQYYFYNLKLRMTLITTNKFNKRLDSIDKIYKSAG